MLPKTTWHHIRRYPYQAFSAIFIITQTFLVVSLFTFIIYGSAKIIDHFESIPQVSAFFKNDAQQANIDGLITQLENSDKVASLKYISKQEALEIYQEKFKDDPLLLQFVTADMLPASVEVATDNIDDLASVSETLKGAPIVQEVVFPRDVISNLTAWTNALRKIGIVLIAVLALDSIFIMMIIIGIKISHRREEIEIMRLIGATGWYIRWPFVMEGIFYGIVGALLGWAISVGILFYATPFLTSFMRGIPILPFPPIFLLEVLAGELIFAIVLGIISSFLAVLRYLK